MVREEREKSFVTNMANDEGEEKLERKMGLRFFQAKKGKGMKRNVVEEKKKNNQKKKNKNKGFAVALRGIDETIPFLLFW